MQPFHSSQHPSPCWTLNVTSTDLFVTPNPVRNGHPKVESGPGHLSVGTCTWEIKASIHPWCLQGPPLAQGCPVLCCVCFKGSVPTTFDNSRGEVFQKGLMTTVYTQRSTLEGLGMRRCSLNPLIILVWNTWSIVLFYTITPTIRFLPLIILVWK